MCVDCALDDLDTLLHDDVAREQSARHEGQVAHWPRGPMVIELFLNCFVRLADFFEQAVVVEGEDCDKLAV